MPKLKLAKRSPSPANLKANIRWHLEKRGLSYDDAAVVAGMSRSTFFNRMRYPEEFTIKELALLAECFGISLQALQFGEIKVVAI